VKATPISMLKATKGEKDRNTSISLSYTLAVCLKIQKYKCSSTIGRSETGDPGVDQEGERRCQGLVALIAEGEGGTKEACCQGHQRQV